jgi:hypothetical protein
MIHMKEQLNLFKQIFKMFKQHFRRMKTFLANIQHTIWKILLFKDKVILGFRRI